jgi:hypothetical protein
LGQPRKAGSSVAVFVVAGHAQGHELIKTTSSTITAEEKRNCSSARRRINSQNSLQEGNSMKKLKILGAVVIILSAATVLYLVKPMGAQESNPNICVEGSTPNSCLVTITPSEDPNGTPTIYPDSQHIWKNKQQTVEWACDSNHPNCDFTVAFIEQTKRPFHDRVFSNVFSNSHAKSGVATGPPDTYKYSVIVNGTQVKDPQIIIH